MDMLEKGLAVGVYTTVLLVRSGERVFMSFDGREWEETSSELVRSQI